MASIDTSTSSGKHAGSYLKKLQTRIDMTPMVDLGFLLITFFVMTARLSEPSSLSLILPKDDKSNPMPVADSEAMTVLVNGPSLYYYMGDFEQAAVDHRIFRANLAGNGSIREIIRKKQDELDRRLTGGAKTTTDAGREGLVFLMKAGPQASYKMVVNLMDETIINGISRHMLLSMSVQEQAYLDKLAGTTNPD